MIEFKKIEGSSDPLFAPMFELYHEAFPPSERRTLDDLTRILDTEPRFTASALMREGQFAGFFTHWTFDRFVYGEHFAVDSALRGQNLGTETIQAFLALHTLPVVLEVEMPDEPDAHPYAQPYYDGSGRMLPMLIMTNDTHFANKNFPLIKKTLYEEVYGVTVND